MPPITATSAGIARQTIDDPALVSLLERLSEFDDDTVVAAKGSGSATDDAAAADAGTPTVVAADGHAGAAVDDGDVIMGDAQSDNDNAPPFNAPSNARLPPPPFDVDKLASELDGVPRWQFQEQVSFK